MTKRFKVMIRSIATITCLATLFWSWPPTIAAERFGGVEIGAKGVKVSAVEIDEAGDSPRLTVLELDKKTVDVTISRLKGKKFNPTIIADVADVTKEFITALENELKVPSDNIQVVASSGVQWVGNFADLIAVVQEKTGKVLTQVDAAEEARLTATILVPKDRRADTLVVDIGSGNTKGAEFLDDSAAPDRFATFFVPFGTTTLSIAIDEAATAAGQSRSSTIARTVRQKVGQSFREQLPKSVTGNKSKAALMSGGSVWAMVTLTHPETALEKFPRITSADIDTYWALLEKAQGKHPVIDFEQIADPAVRKAAQADYDRICGTPGKEPIFKPEELQAGAALLQQIAAIFEFGKRPAYFDRKGVTAWITAKITPEKHRHLLPISLGRDTEFIPKVAAVAAPQILRFGGIEIGAKGIKLATVQVDLTGPQQVLRVPKIDDATSNTTISELKDKKLDPTRIQDVVSEVDRFAKILESKFDVPRKNIQVVVSSGVPWVANIGDLRGSLVDRTGISVDEVTPEEESLLNALTILPISHRTVMSTIDIGSGSTKGGEFLTGTATKDDFVSFSVPFGTKTFSAVVEKEMEKAGISRSQAAQNIVGTLVGQPLQQQLPASTPSSKEPRRILLTGGATWAFITMMKPETAKHKYVAIHHDDIRQFVALLDKFDGKFPEVNFASVADLEARGIAQADFAKICGTSGKEPIFKPQELRAAAALLSEVCDRMEFSRRKVFFDRAAATAWITAKITPPDYRHLLFEASGRSLAPAKKAAAAVVSSTTKPVLNE